MKCKKIYYSVNIIYSKDLINESNLTQIKNFITFCSNFNIEVKLNELIVSNEKESTLNISFKNNKWIVNNNKLYENLIKIKDDYLLVPKIFIKQYDKLKFKINLSKIEKEKSYLLKNEYGKLNSEICQNFNVMNGIDDIYDRLTGAVIFKDYEWIEIREDNKLKKLFEKKDFDGDYMYSLPLDFSISLRGSEVYYYFSAYIDRMKKPNKEQIVKWSKNCNVFIDEAVNALKDFKIKNSYDIRLALAVIDNLRNIILLMFNSCILCEKGEESFLININKNEEINKWQNVLNKMQDFIHSLCFNKYDSNNISHQICHYIINVKNLLKDVIKKILNLEDEFILGKCFNPIREVDNYFENYITLKYSINKLQEDNKLKDKKIFLIGILYGGLELPFIIKKIGIECKGIDIGIAFHNNGMYLDKQKLALNVAYNKLTIDNSIDKNESYNILVDDNVMSGVTMQLLINDLALNGIKVNKAIAIRHPNTNRMVQLNYFNVAIDLEMIDKFFQGMLCDTPYTKLRENTNYAGMFTNEINIFSLMTEVYLKALYRNNTFIKNSEVDIFKGFSNGKF